MEDANKPANSHNPLPDKMGVFSESKDQSTINVRFNIKAHEITLVMLRPALLLLSLPRIQKALEGKIFYRELSPILKIELDGPIMFEVASDNKEPLSRRIGLAHDLLRQLPEKMGLKDDVHADVLLRRMLTNRADLLKQCSDKHNDGTGNLDMVRISIADGQNPDGPANVPK